MFDLFLGAGRVLMMLCGIGTSEAVCRRHLCLIVGVCGRCRIFDGSKFSALFRKYCPQSSWGKI